MFSPASRFISVLDFLKTSRFICLLILNEMSSRDLAKLDTGVETEPCFCEGAVDCFPCLHGYFHELVDCFFTGCQENSCLLRSGVVPRRSWYRSIEISCVSVIGPKMYTRSSYIRNFFRSNILSLSGGVILGYRLFDVCRAKIVG